MYKILIRNRDSITENTVKSTIEKFSFYKEASKDFETTDIIEALDKMNCLLDSYLRKDIFLINAIETETELTSAEIKLIKVSQEIIKIVNDGEKFALSINLPEDSNYVVVDINEEIFGTVKKSLEELGFENVKISPKKGITATNSTGMVIETVLDIEKGLFTFYSRETGTSNYISSSFSVLIKEAEETPDDNDDSVIDPVDPSDPDNPEKPVEKKLVRVKVANNYSATMYALFTPVIPEPPKDEETEIKPDEGCICKCENCISKLEENKIRSLDESETENNNVENSEEENKEEEIKSTMLTIAPNDQASTELLSGEYTFRMSAAGYKSASGTIILRNNVLLTPVLKKDDGTTDPEKPDVKCEHGNDPDTCLICHPKDPDEEGDNHNNGGETLPAYDMSTVKFEDQTFVYNSARPRSITISGTLPDGVTVEYENNNQIEVGVYTVIAHFKGDDKHKPIPDMTATMTIILPDVNPGEPEQSGPSTDQEQ